MRKHLKLFVSFFVFCCMVMLFPKMDVQAATNLNKALSFGTTYSSYDITGNGKKDTLKLTKTYDKDYYNLSGEKMYTGVKVSVNGKITKISADYQCYTVKARLLRLTNGKCYLSIIGQSNNGDDPFNALYRYKDGAIRKAYNLGKIYYNFGNHCQPSIAGVSGNTIKIKHFIMSKAMAGVTVQYSYTYDSAKKELKRAKPYGKVLSMSYKSLTNSIYDALRISRTLYSSYSCTKQIKTVKSGTLATPTYIYMSGDKIRIKLKFKDGSTGWVKGNNTWTDSKILFRNAFYAG